MCRHSASTTHDHVCVLSKRNYPAEAKPAPNDGAPAAQKQSADEMLDRNTAVKESEPVKEDVNQDGLPPFLWKPTAGHKNRGGHLC